MKCLYALAHTGSQIWARFCPTGQLVLVPEHIPIITVIVYYILVSLFIKVVVILVLVLYRIVRPGGTLF